MDELEIKILGLIDEKRETLISLGNYLFDHAERGFYEQGTAELISAELKKLGLTPKEHLAGTGLKAELPPVLPASGCAEKHQKTSGCSDSSMGRPVNLALIGELDGILCPSHPHATPEGMSHACGHHGQLMAMLGAAIALTDPEISKALCGTVTFFAVPAEEFLSEDIRSVLRKDGISTHSGGKAELISRGDFDDIDMAITSHAHMIPCEDFDLVLGNSACTGFIGKTITMHGKAAHAAGAPHKGVNAMNAAALGLSALGMIRETFQEKDYIRVHPIIREAGTAINVVPDIAVIDMMVRAGSLRAVAEVSEKVNRAFRGAAYSIGTEIEIQDTTGYLPVIERLADEVMIEAAKLIPGITYTSITPGLENMTSTDVGDLTHLMPVLNFTFGGLAGALHSKDFQVTDEEKFFVMPAKFMALTAYRLLKNQAEGAQKILAEFKPALTMEEYLEYINK